MSEVEGVGFVTSLNVHVVPFLIAVPFHPQDVTLMGTYIDPEVIDLNIRYMSKLSSTITFDKIVLVVLESF